MVTAAEIMGGQRMTKARAEALTEPGRYPEGTVTGLFLRIAPGGSKQWIQRVRINGVRVDKGLGPFPRVGIAEARNLAERNRALIHVGEDPWAGKQQNRAQAEERASALETRRAMPTFLEGCAVNGRGAGAHPQTRGEEDREVAPFSRTSRQGPAQHTPRPHHPRRRGSGRQTHLAHPP